MTEVSVFDAYQVQRALRGHLADDDAMETIARDEATGSYWVLTHRELILVKDQQVGDRLARDEIAGSIDRNDVAVSVRLRGHEPGTAIVGTFRKPNRLTNALAEIVQDTAR